MSEPSQFGHQTDRAGSPPSIPMLSRLWWTPLAFAILALILLAVTPIIVDRRVNAIRNALQNGSDRARVALNDLEAAFASQALVTDSVAARDTVAIATHGHLLDDEIELQTILRRVSPEAARRFEALNQRLLAWSETRKHGSSSLADAEETRAILGDAERLDAYLTTVSDSLREHAQTLEHFDFIAATILAPMALIAMLIVLWAGNQLVRFARAVDLERAEVIRSTHARAALLRGVTHDVKNPLGAASGFAQLLEEGVVGPLTQPQLDMIKRVRRLVKSSVEIVTDLLDVARDDGEDPQVELAETDLGPLTQEVVTDHGGMAREYGVTVDVVAPSTMVTTDATRVRRILANLVSNAIKYTPKGGRVGVRVKTGRLGTRNAIGVEVADTGPGIPPQLRDRVFDEFFRVNGEKASQPAGNGLGLAISRRLARLLGGDIVLEDNKGGGSVFTLWLQARVPQEQHGSDGKRATA